MRQRSTTGGRRGGLWWSTLAAAVVGVILVVVAVATQTPAAPELSGPVGTVGDSPTASPPADPEPTPTAPPEVEAAKQIPLGPSQPTRIEIPALDVSSPVFAIGKTENGALAVPQPGPNLDKAAWFENSPTPGQPGPSIIEGHVATDEGGPSIFYELADLRPGDTIRVTREDRTTVEFTVRGLREFAKDKFPTELVYGGDIATPTLRLITCSNFDPSVGGHTANLIVFSELTRVIKG